MRPAANLLAVRAGNQLVPPYRDPLPWGRRLRDVVAPMVTEAWRSAPPTASYPEIYPLTMLERAGRSFETLVGG